MPISVSVRRLSDSVLLCFVNLFLILAVLAVVMGKMYIDGRPAHVNTFAFAEDLSFWGVFGAASNVVYSYAGHWLYFELMADMEKPEDFPRVFWINVPIQVCLYLLVACWGYHFAGDKAKGYFLDNLPDGDAYRVASTLLFVHVLIAFLVKNVVLVRALHKMIAPSRVDVQLGESGGRRAQAEFAICAVLLLWAYWAVANAVPFFSDFLQLVGSVFSGPISYVLPAVFLLGALRLEDSRPVPGRAAGDDQSKELKSRADDAFRAQDFQAAVALYTQALVWAPRNERLLSNRSAAYAAIGQFKSALEDAVKCEELAPEWSKGVFRRGVALRGLKRYDMAISAFAQGLEQDPSNPNWHKEIEETERLRDRTCELGDRINRNQPDVEPGRPRRPSFSMQCREAYVKFNRFDMLACTVITAFVLMSMATCP
eukprot:symbB.v1.2.040060.t3/scaffold6963.1/size14182/2